MKRFYLIVLLSFIFFNSIAQLNENIRRKVENLTEFGRLNKAYEIYCIPSIREVYLSNSFAPFWTDVKQVNEFIDIIAKCNEDGLNPEDYHLTDITKMKKGIFEENKADLDIVLTDAFLLFVSHILSGKTNPETIDAEWHVQKTDKNPLKYLYQIKSKRIKLIVAEIVPKNKNYETLKTHLKFYRELETKDLQKKVSKGQIIKPGMTDSRIIQIRNFIKLTTDFDVTYKRNDEYYDDTLKNLVIDFQKRHGLEALGVIGDQTIEAINIPFKDKIKSIEVNLERLRWLPQELPNYYFMVNIVNFELDVVADNIIKRNHKVIVGKTYRKTPVFSATMQYLVFNPTWTIPSNILKNDIIPEVRKNNDFLKKKRISVINHNGVKLNPDSVDWKSNKVFSYTYIQEPGKDNALGVVKFIFPNKFSVYLHDTPGKELFDKTERAFSSGCIRVQKPLELAAYLLKDQAQYSLQEIQKITETAKIQTVVLTKKPEVYLLYLTSWIDDNGQINFRKDIYERDERLYNALNDKPEHDIKF